MQWQEAESQADYAVGPPAIRCKTHAIRSNENTCESEANREKSPKNTLDGPFRQFSWRYRGPQAIFPLKSGVFATHFVMPLSTLSSNTPMSRQKSFFRELAPLGLIYGPAMACVRLPTPSALLVDIYRRL